jgi:hypothetical protein
MWANEYAWSRDIVKSCRRTVRFVAVAAGLQAVRVRLCDGNAASDLVGLVAVI